MKSTILANRLADIVSMAYSDQSLKIEKLAEKHHVSSKTIRRDFERLGSILERCSTTGCYHLSSSSRIAFNEHDLVRLISGLGLKKALPNKTAKFLKNLINNQTNDYYHFQESPLELEFIDSQHTFFERAIKNRQTVQFLYKDKVRNVHPYMMVYSRGSWYLAALADDVLKAYSLARIKFVSINKEHFNLDHRIIAQIKEHDSIWFGLPAFKIILEVAPNVSFFFERKPLFPRQEILERKSDGTLILSASAWSYSQITPLIQSWLPNIKVISPPELNEHIRNNLSQWMSYTAEITEIHSYE
ncbi:WYL domain-containing protein [Shewanella sp. 1CM18E]|uniref:helix-turn-helix transcriptional regulator n=1 Tax=Shewanella sp. 1CM18E TaxID=2929169 RepID=UPI0020C120F9|nr:WYL domain-containing protein [Shewanella sp. 1CM18E]MCK8045337.1 WYL domain-containing protein [Shewanella sp. 1CM18E]